MSFSHSQEGCDSSDDENPLLKTSIFGGPPVSRAELQDAYLHALSYVAEQQEKANPSSSQEKKEEPVLTTKKEEAKNLETYFTIFERRVSELITQEINRCREVFNRVLRNEYATVRINIIYESFAPFNGGYGVKIRALDETKQENRMLGTVHVLKKVADEVDEQKKEDTYFGTQVSVFASRLRDLACEFLLFYAGYLKDVHVRIGKNKGNVFSRLGSLFEKTDELSEIQKSHEEVLGEVLQLVLELQKKNRTLLFQLDLARLNETSLESQLDRARISLKDLRHELSKTYQDIRYQKNLVDSLESKNRALETMIVAGVGEVFFQINECEKALVMNKTQVRRLVSLSKEFSHGFNNDCAFDCFLMTSLKEQHRKIIAQLERAGAEDEVIHQTQVEYTKTLESLHEQVKEKQKKFIQQMTEMREILLLLEESTNTIERFFSEVREALSTHHQSVEEHIERMSEDLLSVQSSVDQALSDGYEATKRQVSILLTTLNDQKLLESERKITESMIEHAQKMQEDLLTAETRMVGTKAHLGRCHEKIREVKYAIQETKQVVMEMDALHEINYGFFRGIIRRELDRIKAIAPDSEKVTRLEAVLNTMDIHHRQPNPEPYHLVPLIQALSLHRNPFTWWKNPNSFDNVQREISNHFQSRGLESVALHNIRLRC